MRVRNTLLSLLLAVPFVGAVFRDEVGDIDFHHTLVGVPLPERTFFHRPRKDDRASLLYTLSDVGIIGAVNPGSGALVWRQPLSRDNLTTSDDGGFLRVGDGENWLAAAHGSSVHAWSAMSGRNMWWADFAGTVRDLEMMELTASGEKDVLALFEEDRSVVARRLSGTTGKVVWEHRESGHEVPLQVSTDSARIFLVSLQGRPSAYVVKVVVLDSLTGHRLQEAVLDAGGAVEGPEDVMFVGANSAASIVAWTDKARTSLKVNLLGTATLQEFPLGDGVESVAIHAPHLVQSEPHFLVHSRTSTGNRAQVFHIDLKSGKIAVAYDLPHLPGHGAFSVSSDGSNVYFTRITEDEVLLVSSTSHGVLARWPIESASPLAPVHCASEVLRKADGSFAVRSAATTKSGDWTLIRSGHVDWTRPEGLSGAVAGAWAEVPETEHLAEILDAEAHTDILAAYIHRVKRHVNDLQHLPAYLGALPGRVLGSIIGSDLGAKKNSLARDSFGFHKIVILATARGRLYGLDFGDHGRILWSLDAFEQPNGRHWDVKGIHVDNHKNVVTVRGSLGESITANVVTGYIVESSPAGSSPPIQGAAMVTSDRGEWMLPIGVGGHIGDIPAGWVPKETVVVRGATGELRGIFFGSGHGAGRGVVAWTFSPPAGQLIVSIAARPAHDPIATIGRSLGDRRVLYKYLDPNTLLIAAMDPTKLVLTTYLLDGVSGQILASSTYKGVDPSKPINCILSENWFMCSFFGHYKLSDGSGRTVKGYQIAVSDLFESTEPNDRGPLEDTANVSSIDPLETPFGPPLPAVFSQTYILSAPATHLAATQTRQGITVRGVLAYLPDVGAIALLPRQLLDPRRPVGRDPSPAELEAEGLVKYAPAIDIDPRSLITHEREVLGVRQILASPTGVESTSLVIALGVDVFGTRVAPGMTFDILGKSFNKISMILTVTALFVGVVGLRPMVSVWAFRLSSAPYDGATCRVLTWG
jgi:hypothetical protein